MTTVQANAVNIPSSKKGIPGKPPNYKRLSDDDLFRHSSQYRFWSFTPEQLEQRRIEVNAQAVQSIEQDLRNFIDARSTELNEEEIRTIENRAVPVNMEEELKLVNLYAKKVQTIAQRLNLPTEIVATSITFFRRFYLENSVMKIEPKAIVLTTIFLACKSENYFIGIDSFCEKTRGDKEQVLKYEFPLLESLKFSLLSHHPYRPLHGFFLDIQAVLHGKVDLSYMGHIYDRCKKRITDALLTDAVYFYSPPQVTLAVLMLEDEALTTRYLELKFHGNDTNQGNAEDEASRGNGNVTIQLDKLMKIVTNCSKLIEKPTTVPVEEAKSIAARLYFCQNPDDLLKKMKKRKADEQDSSVPVKKPKTE